MSAQESARESDVVERALDMLSVIEYAQHRRCSPAYPDSSVHSVIASLVAEVERLTAERDEARTEVERLEADLDGAAYRAGRKQGELAEARAAVERLRTDLARMTEQAEASILELRDVTRELGAVHGDLAESRAAIDRVRQVTARWAGPNPELSTVPVDEVLRALDGEVSGE